MHKHHGFCCCLSGDSNTDVATQSIGHGPKGTKGNSPAGAGVRMVKGVQQGRGRAVLQFQGARALLLTVSTPSPVACTGLVPLIRGLRKIPFFPTLFPKILPRLPRCFVHLLNATTARSV